MIIKIAKWFADKAWPPLAQIWSKKVLAQWEADLVLFEQLKRDLPSDGSIAFIDEQNMAGFSFDIKELDDLYKFLHVWGDAEHEFLGRKLEQKRSGLYDLVNRYLTCIGHNTFGTPKGWQSVPAEWEVEQPDRFKEVVSELHHLAGQVVSTHQDLFRTARRQLKC